MAAPLPRDVVEETMARELGRPLDEVRSSVEWQPLGSASIAEAHAAQLLDGTSVVVKIRRQALRRRVEPRSGHRSLVRPQHRPAVVMGRAFDVRGLTDEFSDALLEELDFCIEARHIAEVAEAVGTLAQRSADVEIDMGDADLRDDGRRDGERLLRSRHHKALATIVTEGMPGRHGSSFMDQRGGMEPGPRAVAVLYSAANTADCDGFPAIYHDLGDLGGELVWAAEHVGAGAYADLFRRVEQAIPEDARLDATRREAFVLDHEHLFEAFDEAYYALENAGDILLEHAIRYMLAHPEEFTTYRS